MHLSKPAYRIFPYRNVAWGWNGIYPLGALSWPFSYTGTCVAWEKTGKTAWNRGLGLHSDRGVFWMDSVPCRKYFPVFHLCEKYLDSKMIFLIVMGVLFAGVLQKIYEKVRVHSAGKIPANGMVTVPRMIACMVIFWLSVAALVNNSYNPFIYFRF